MDNDDSLMADGVLNIPDAEEFGDEEGGEAVEGDTPAAEPEKDEAF